VALGTLSPTFAIICSLQLPPQPAVSRTGGP
jgi:hypothetical protein